MDGKHCGKRQTYWSLAFLLFSQSFQNIFFIRVVLNSKRCPDINPLSDKKYLDMTKLKAFADDKLTLSQTTSFRLFQTEKKFQTTILILMKMAESSPKEKKTLWEKEKLLVTSNFSFSLSVFKRLVLQTRKNQGLFGVWERVKCC